MLILNSLRAYRVKCSINNIFLRILCPWYKLHLCILKAIPAIYCLYELQPGENIFAILLSVFWVYLSVRLLWRRIQVCSVPRFGLLPSQGPPIEEGGFKGGVRIYNFHFSRLTNHLAPRAPVPYNVCLKSNSQ